MYYAVICLQRPRQLSTLPRPRVETSACEMRVHSIATRSAFQVDAISLESFMKQWLLCTPLALRLKFSANCKQGAAIVCLRRVSTVSAFSGAAVSLCEALHWTDTNQTPFVFLRIAPAAHTELVCSFRGRKHPAQLRSSVGPHSAAGPLPRSANSRQHLHCETVPCPTSVPN
jgi:hypothetical protein